MGFNAWPFQRNGGNAVLFCAALPLTILFFHQLHPIHSKYSVIRTEDGDFEIPADADERLREQRPRPNLSLAVLGFETMKGEMARLKLKMWNQGVSSPVKQWHVTAEKNGRFDVAAVQTASIKTISAKSSQDGYLLVNLPPSFGENAKGVTWSIGYQDSCGLWRWTESGS